MIALQLGVDFFPFIFRTDDVGTTVAETALVDTSCCEPLLVMMLTSSCQI